MILNFCICFSGCNVARYCDQSAQETLALHHKQVQWLHHRLQEDPGSRIIWARQSHVLLQPCLWWIWWWFCDWKKDYRKKSLRYNCSLLVFQSVIFPVYNTVILQRCDISSAYIKIQPFCTNIWENKFIPCWTLDIVLSGINLFIHITNDNRKIEKYLMTSVSTYFQLLCSMKQNTSISQYHRSNTGTYFNILHWCIFHCSCSILTISGVPGAWGDVLSSSFDPVSVSWGMLPL